MDIRGGIKEVTKTALRHLFVTKLQFKEHILIEQGDTMPVL